MNRKHLAILASYLLLGATSLSACSLLNFGKKPTAAISLSGDWQFAYVYDKQATQASLHINQKGNSFSGSGIEDKQQFAVSNGQLDGQQVSFDKNYGPNSGPPVHYTGAVEMVDGQDYKGPWMHGSYLTTVKGKPVQGDWEAQLTPESNKAAQPGQAADQVALIGPAAPTGQAGQSGQASDQNALIGPATNQVSGDKTSKSDNDGILEDAASTATADDSSAPQLSGKWTVAYEYNFKTVQSTMYLEQDGTKLVGHGVDLNTKEKFTIGKGWYSYPKVTLIRQYHKGKGGAAADRTLTFKADVKKVNNGAYQGVSLEGKTQGGGTWTAQLVR